MRVWRTLDVLAHVAPEAAEAGAPAASSSLDDEELLDTAGVAAYVLVGPDVLRGYIKRARWQWMPEPAGKAGSVHYWTLSAVQAWLASAAGVAAMSRRRARRAG